MRMNTWIATLGVLLLTTTAPPALAADVELSFRFNDPEAKEMRAALDAFEQENPGVKVELQTIAWGESRQQFLREAAVGEGPTWCTLPSSGRVTWGPPEPCLRSTTFSSHSRFRVVSTISSRPSSRSGRTATSTGSVDDRHLGDGVSHRRVGSGRGRRDPARLGGVARCEPGHPREDRQGRLRLPRGSGPSNTIWFLANYYWWSNGSALVVADGDGFTTGITVEQIAGAMAYYDSFFKEGHNPESMLGVTSWFDPSILEGMTDGEQGIAIMPPQQFKQILASYRERNPGKEPPS